MPASILSHPGSYTVHGRISDKDGGYTQLHHHDSGQQCRADREPARLSANVNEGTLYTQTGSFVDPGGGPETWTATVNYGDGSGVQPLTLNTNKTFTLNHTYATSGPDTVTVTVDDSYGGVGTAQIMVNVAATTFQVTSV